METEKRSRPAGVAAKDECARTRSPHWASNQPSKDLPEALGTYAERVPTEEVDRLAEMILRLRQESAESKPLVEFRKKTCTVEEAGRLCGISRGSAYKAAHSGQLPVERIGRRILVLVEPLMRMLDGEHTDSPSPAAKEQDPIEGGQQ